MNMISTSAELALSDCPAAHRHGGTGRLPLLLRLARGGELGLTVSGINNQAESAVFVYYAGLHC